MDCHYIEVGVKHYGQFYAIYTMPNIKPMNVAIYCREKKPESLQVYLNPLVEELNVLIQQGVSLGSPPTTVFINVRAFVCDSPARSFIKGVTSHVAKHGCLKFTVVGYHHPISRTTCFPGTNARLRTDAEFCNYAYGEHHKEPTPLMRLKNFDLIKDVIIADELHLMHLGVQRKML
uniref:Uncharacterized protein n=1 Tax=Anopheles epiroticus TaxID=199890 RepID=A0A182PU69_9DIPT